MPSWCRWLWIGVAVASPWACAATQPPPSQPPAAPAPPSAALLEFLAEWDREERELLTMDEQQTKRKLDSASQTTPGDRRAP